MITKKTRIAPKNRKEVSEQPIHCIFISDLKKKGIYSDNLA